MFTFARAYLRLRSLFKKHDICVYLRLVAFVCLCKRPLSLHPLFRKLEKAVAVRISTLLENSSPIFWQHGCYSCQGLGIFRQGERLLDHRPRLQERSWIFSSETATEFLSLDGPMIRNANQSDSRESIRRKNNFITLER